MGRAPGRIYRYRAYVVEWMSRAQLERKMNVVRSVANKFRRQTTIFRSSKYW